MRNYIILLLLLMIRVTDAQVFIPKFDVQGHRGARGIKPENTIPAFITALDHGVTTVELDVAISADRHVVVSHEPWMSAEICLKPDGSEILKSEEMSFNMYQMTYEEIQKFDCGSKGNSQYPEQQKMKASKPLLRDVIIAVEDHIRSYTQYEVDYNIEIKSREDGDNKFHPSPQEFSDLVYKLIDQYLPVDRVVIQSFDMRVLQYWNTKYPSVRLAFLVANSKSPQKNIQELGFTPTVYSPYFKSVTKEHVDYIHTLTYSKPNVTNGKTSGQVTSKMRIIPWTVNEVDDMNRLKTMGVDGIITDYPNRAAETGLGLKAKANGNGTTKK